MRGNVLGVIFAVVIVGVGPCATVFAAAEISSNIRNPAFLDLAEPSAVVLAQSKSSCTARSSRAHNARCRFDPHVIQAQLYLGEANPSFDCQKAQAVDEITICSNEELATLDREMAQLYDNILANSRRPNDQFITHNQKQWLKARSGCGSDVVCVREQYIARIRAFSAGIGATQKVLKLEEQSNRWYGEGTSLIYGIPGGPHDNHESSNVLHLNCGRRSGTVDITVTVGEFNDGYEGQTVTLALAVGALKSVFAGGLSDGMDGWYAAATALTDDPIFKAIREGPRLVILVDSKWSAAVPLESLGGKVNKFIATCRALSK